ncbi:MAG: rod shape-determining protein MreD [Actinomycetota bacterium]
MRRALVFALTLLSAVLLQTTVFGQLRIAGVSPDLLLAVVISFALLEGPSAGAVLGFAGGFLRDLLLDAPVGITGLSYLVIGYLVGSIRPYIGSNTVFVPAAGIFLGSMGATALYEVFQALLGQRTPPLSRAMSVIALTALYNTILVPFIYPPVRRIASFYRPEKVYQW